MRQALTGAAATLMIALAGCGESGPDNAAEAEAPGPDAIQNQLATMAEGQRNGVFIRAIRDAGQPCQHVESSERAGEHQGFPMWNATCSGGGSWSIVVMNDGTATVLNAGGNEAARKGQGK